MSEHKWDPDGIRQAAKNLLAAPLTYLTEAHAKAQHECRLAPLAFGICCHFVISGIYEESRSYQGRNLQGAIELLHDTHKRLDTTANTYRDVEAANKIHLV